MYPQVFQSAAIVVAFWWSVLGLIGIFKFKNDLGLALSSSLSVFILCLVGALLGSVAVVAWLILDRQTKKDLLQKDNVRGLMCTIGEVPVNAKEPPRAPVLPVFTGVPNVPENFYPLWIEHYEKTHPQHVALVKAMLQVYELNKDLPATHVKGGHGGRTLLQHSLLVAYQMQTIAMKWTYTGLRSKRGKKVLLKLRDDNYQFNPEDPMVVATGLAHDIGKIEAFIFDGKEIIGSRHEHDLTGARMLARLPEMWSIPDSDRQAILLAIAHYHHPMELPVAPDLRAVDDRTVALMELLIKADFTASAIERTNKVPSETDYDTEMNALEGAENTDELLWESFLELIQESGRINSADVHYNIGTICQVKGQNAMRLVLHEESLRGALMRKMEMDSSPVYGDGRSEVTVRLLRLLDKHGVLVKRFGDWEYGAESALWAVAFHGRKAGKAKGKIEHITGWQATLILLPTVHAYVEQLPSYHWVGTVTRGTLGSGRSKKIDPATGEIQETDEIKQPTEQLAVAQDVKLLDAAQVEVSDPPAIASLDPNGDPDWTTVPVAPVEEETERNPAPQKAQQPAQKHQQGHQKGKKHNDNVKYDVDALNKHSEATKAAAKAVVQHAEELPLQKPTNTAVLEAVFETSPEVSQFIVTAGEQTQKQQFMVTPFSLLNSLQKVIQDDALQTAARGSGSVVYIVPRHSLVKHFPNIEWSEALPGILSLCKSKRVYGVEIMESSGEVFFVVDAMMMKSFMEDGTSPAQAD